jgi:hypothetical protein
MNPLEAQLRSWTPRRPSPEVCETIFGARSIQRREHLVAQEMPLREMSSMLTSVLHGHRGWWIAPMAACFLLVLQLVHFGMPHPGRQNGMSPALFAVVLSNAIPDFGSKQDVNAGRATLIAPEQNTSFLNEEENTQTLRDRNVWAKVTFDWTNEPLSRRSISPSQPDVAQGEFRHIGTASSREANTNFNSLK